MKNIHFIGGEKGGVGKSVVARILAQYCIDNDLPFIGHDSDRSHGTFTRFYADFASPMTVDEYAQLDQLIEEMLTTEDNRILVDLAAQTIQPLSRWIEESELLDLCAEQEIKLTFWHVMDGSKDSVVLLDELLSKFGDGVSYVVVLNHGRGQPFDIFNTSPIRQRALMLGAKLIELRALQSSTMQKIDKANASFWNAIHLKETNGLGLVEQRRVKVWLADAYESLKLLDV
ncbi:hypothetical protein [Beggiatoa leptomitoformis]|uniref:Mobilization protein n=1 Tax=Beggiatoa leptomitoformis TaxID=288004 RepID=A0A2N9YHQ9_9GAMM|nr:hypothetical protein [Beggiatoa leptomitoformis]ALG67724.1 mobilization protein [Beggiatoa leptomitoformis]AUI70037.1 mobilization protein [Beggiatoa leptomitoformis]